MLVSTEVHSLPVHSGGDDADPSRTERMRRGRDPSRTPSRPRRPVWDNPRGQLPGTGIGGDGENLSEEISMEVQLKEWDQFWRCGCDLESHHLESVVFQ